MSKSFIISIVISFIYSCNINSNNKMQNNKMQNNISNDEKTLNHGINNLNNYGYSELHMATSSGNIQKIIKICKNENANLNIKTKNEKKTPLFYLCEGNKNKALKEFLKYKERIDLNMPGQKDGNTALYEVIKNKNDEALKLLIDNGADLKTYYFNYPSPLIASCLLKNELAFQLISQKLISTELDIDFPGKDKKFSALFMMIFNNELKYAEKLLKLGANPNKISISNSNLVKNSPITLACEKNYVEALQLLKRYGGNYEAKNSKNWPLLFICADKNSKNCLKELLEAEVNINGTIAGNYTALWIASFKGHTNIVKQLMFVDEKSNYRKELNVNLKDKENKNALFVAIEKNNNDIADLLFKHPKLILPESYLNHLMFLCCRVDNLKMLKHLKTMAGNYEIKNSRAQSLIYICADKNSPNCMRELLKAKLDINDSIPGNYTPLWIASFRGHTNIVKQLIFDEKNNYRDELDINIKDREGKTALFVAIEKENPEIVNLLMNNPKLKPDQKSYNTFIFPYLMKIILNNMSIISFRNKQ
ncbi:MAG: ankyrin repeat domain-containing protein [Bacteroidetes bacterium]|nr:ankyrin repeat domain-containing protein [Bacteroidota bacterium]